MTDQTRHEDGTVCHDPDHHEGCRPQTQPHPAAVRAAERIRDHAINWTGGFNLTTNDVARAIELEYRPTLAVMEAEQAGRMDALRQQQVLIDRLVVALDLIRVAETADWCQDYIDLGAYAKKVAHAALREAGLTE